MFLSPQHVSGIKQPIYPLWIVEIIKIAQILNQYFFWNFKSSYFHVSVFINNFHLLVTHEIFFIPDWFLILIIKAIFFKLPFSDDPGSHVKKTFDLYLLIFLLLLNIFPFPLNQTYLMTRPGFLNWPLGQTSCDQCLKIFLLNSLNIRQTKLQDLAWNLSSKLMLEILAWNICSKF